MMKLNKPELLEDSPAFSVLLQALGKLSPAPSDPRPEPFVHLTVFFPQSDRVEHTEAQFLIEQ